MNTKHGVLASEGLLTIQSNQWQTVPMHRESDLVNLMQTALDYGLTHLWVHTDEIYPLVPFEVTDDSFKGIIDGWDLMGHCNGEHVKTVTGWKTGGGQKQVTVIFPMYTKWVEYWETLSSPKELLVTINYVEQVLEVPMAGSPGTMGWNLLKKMHPDWVKKFPMSQLTNMHFGAQAAKDLVWQRPYNASEGMYLHKVDRNSAYLSSGVTEFYGVREPIRDVDGSKFKEGSYKDGYRPGVWECEVIPCNAAIPIVDKAKTCYLAAPMIRIMRNQGYEVTVLSGWYFPEAHQILAKWAQFLWDARQGFADEKKFRHAVCRNFARLAIKLIAVATVGLTAYSNFEEQSGKQRPDIKMQTVARTYELMYHNILKFREKTGMMPVMVYTDALYYVTNSPKLPFPEVFLAREGKLGGYKYEGCIEITPDVAEMFATKMSVNYRLEYLNSKGWVK